MNRIGIVDKAVESAHALVGAAHEVVSVEELKKTVKELVEFYIELYEKNEEEK